MNHKYRLTNKIVSCKLFDTNKGIVARCTRLHNNTALRRHDDENIGSTADDTL